MRWQRNTRECIRVVVGFGKVGSASQREEGEGARWSGGVVRVRRGRRGGRWRRWGEARARWCGIGVAVEREGGVGGLSRGAGGRGGGAVACGSGWSGVADGAEVEEEGDALPAAVGWCRGRDG